MIKKTKINWQRLIISIIICEGMGMLGSMATTPKIGNWYSTLNKPFFNPPSWIFAPVWTLLFLLMGISLYLGWEKYKSLTKPVFKWFWIQLVLNTLWSFIFFGMEKPGLALIEIIILWWSIRKTMKNFRLLTPYLAWVSFATILNGAIWWLNK